MGNTYLALYTHLVWSTANRHPWIDAAWQPRLYAYMGGIARQKNARLLAAGGMPDHVHLLVSLPATLSLAQLVNTLKSSSSGWIHDTIPDRRAFAWQQGYAAFSVGQSGIETVTRYLRNQADHHRQTTFEDELPALFEQHGIEADLRYLWR